MGSQQSAEILHSLSQRAPAPKLTPEDFFQFDSLELFDAPEWNALLLTVYAFIYLGTATFALGGRVPRSFPSRMSPHLVGLAHVSRLAFRVLRTAARLHRLIRNIRTVFPNMAIPVPEDIVAARPQSLLDSTSRDKSPGLIGRSCQQEGFSFKPLCAPYT
jgi:hypothetical protein